MRKFEQMTLIVLSVLLIFPAVARVTSMGGLTIEEDGKLYYRGKTLQPGVEANKGLSFVRSFKIGKGTTVLLRNEGSAHCPAMYQFVTLLGKTSEASPPFGSCSQYIRISQPKKSGYVLVTMPDFQPEGVDPELRQQANAKRRIFRFDGYSVYENDDIIKH